MLWEFSAQQFIYCKYYVGVLAACLYTNAMHLGLVSDYNRTPSILWTRGGFTFGWDVTWTAAGNIAVSDSNANAVSLYNTAGEEITNTSTQGVELRYPYGITYHKTWHGGVIVVVEERRCNLTALDPVSLHKVDTIDLKQHCIRLFGVTTLPSGDMAVSGDIDMGPGVIVVSLSGEIQYKWKLPTTAEPCYIMSTSDDHLLVTVFSGNTICKTTLGGEIIWQTDASTTPNPFGVIQDYTTSHILATYRGNEHQIWVLSSTTGGRLLQHPLLPPKGVTWNSLFSLSLQGQHLAVLHGDRLELYILHTLQHR